MHAQAKRDPAFRFYTLSDKVWRQDMLEAAWQAVRRNGEACDADGETVAAVQELSVDRRLGLTGARAARGQLPAVRRAAGADPEGAAGAIPRLGHTVPARSGSADGGDAGAIADLRSGPATGAVCLPSRARCAGRSSARASVGEQWASGDRGRGLVEITSGRFRTRNCCGRWRANNGCLLRWVKRWLEMAVEEDDRQGGQRRTNRVRRKGLRSCRYPAMSTCGGSS